MDIHEISKLLDRAASTLYDEGYLSLPDDLTKAEKQIEEEIGLRWTQASELAEALNDMACQHKCGCGHPHCNRCADDKMCADALAKWKEASRE